jgi:serine/threonine-protein kinase
MAEVSGHEKTLAGTPGTEPAAASAPTSPGAPERIGGRYEILGLLGAGGMGRVYRAHDHELDELVALKVLRRELYGTAGALQRFRREVKLSRRVTHRNVARVFDIGEHAGETFFTMELVEGESLGRLLERERRLPVPTALSLAAELCAGLGAAHAAGVVHRDLKPDNVLVAKDRRVVITDFGIARASMEAGGMTGGVLVGTPAYMAPEQVDGSAEIDGRADIYALGALLFEAVVGEPPWQGLSAIATLAARLVSPPPDPRARCPELPEALAQALARCLARQRDDRYPDAAALAADLARVAAALGPAPAPPPPSRAQVARGRAPAAAGSDKIVAVLPLRNGGPPEDAYLAGGLTDDLIDALSMTRGLRVVSRGAVQGLGESDPREIGRRLGVQVVVDGSVRRAGGVLRINARLLGVDDGFQIWATRFDRPESDLFACSDEAARAIVAALTAGDAAPAREAPADPIAIDFYLRGRAAAQRFDEFGTSKVGHEMIAAFEAALARAPDNPTILAAYAIACCRVRFYLGTAGDRARAGAERAVAVAPQLGESHLARALVHHYEDDPTGALVSVLRAVGAAPSLAEAHDLLGRLLIDMDLVDEARPYLQAASDLAPQLPWPVIELARLAAFERDYDRTEAILEGAHVRLPSIDARAFYWARFAQWRGDPAHAREVAASFATDHPMTRLMFEVAVTGVLTEEQRAAFRREATGGARYAIFMIQLAAEAAMRAGRQDVAFEEIERAVEAGLRDLAWVRRCPLLDPLRGHPRLAAAEARVAERVAPAIAAWRATSTPVPR